MMKRLLAALVFATVCSGSPLQADDRNVDALGAFVYGLAGLRAAVNVAYDDRSGAEIKFCHTVLNDFIKGRSFNSSDVILNDWTLNITPMPPVFWGNPNSDQEMMLDFLNLEIPSTQVQIVDVYSFTTTILIPGRYLYSNISGLPSNGTVKLSWNYPQDAVKGGIVIDLTHIQIPIDPVWMELMAKTPHLKAIRMNLASIENYKHIKFPRNCKIKVKLGILGTVKRCYNYNPTEEIIDDSFSDDAHVECVCF